MTIAAWMPIIKRLDLNLAACTILDSGLLWAGGLWLDKSYLESPEKVDKILSLLVQRPGLFLVGREKTWLAVLSSKKRSPARLLQLKKKGQLFAEKWDMRLLPEEEVPIAEWFRLFNHVSQTGWIECEYGAIVRINRFHVSLEAFCPAPLSGNPGWKHVYFGSHVAILKNQEDTAEVRATKEDSALFNLHMTFASHIEKGKVGIISYEDGEQGNQKRKVTMTKTSRVRLPQWGDVSQKK